MRNLKFSIPRIHLNTPSSSGTKINLKDIHYYIINLEEDNGRKDFMETQMKELGLKYRFVPGVKVKPQPIGIALSHLKILRMKEIRRPFAILEDDCQFYAERFKSELTVPAETDGIYLGHSTFGVRNKDQYGLRWGKHKSAKYKIYDSEYIQILSMLSRHAIIYLSEKFHKNAIKANQKALLNYDFPFPGDMAYAEIQSDHLLLSPYEPWCYQSEKHFGNHPATRNSLLNEIKPVTGSEITFVENEFPFFRKSFYLCKRDGQLIVQINKGSNHRSQISIEMFHLANEKFQLPDFPLIFIDTDSYCDSHKVNEIRRQTNQPDLPILSYSGTKDMAREYLIPDSYFLNFPQIEIPDYDVYCRSISAAGDKLPNTNKAGWTGNPRNVSIEVKDQNPRKIFIQYAKQRPELFEANPVPFVNSVSECEGFIPLQLQIKTWKYLVDIEGYGYSGRLKFLLFSKRVVLLQDRPWNEWYYFDLKPFVHYIPVKRDFSDLEVKYNWIESRPEEYEQIRMNAYEFASKYLTNEKALERLSQIIRNIQK